MSDMQLYLIALGAIFIAGVILFNWWQERRLSQDAIRRFDGPEGDALMEDPQPGQDREIEFDESAILIDEQYESVSVRIDPTEAPPETFLDAAEPEDIPIEAIPQDTLLSELPGATQDDAIEEANAEPVTSIQEREQELDRTPVISDTEDEPSFNIDEVDAPVAEQSALPPSMDEQIDLVGLVHLASPRTGAELREALQPLPGFEKATQWLGLDDTGNWVALTKDQEPTLFNRVACSLQFADRSGPFSRECLRKFQHKIESLAEHLEAVLEWRGNGDPLKYSTEIDQFCIDVDVMVGFHIMHGANGPFAATKLRGIAEAGGMTLHDDGTFHFVTAEGDTIFTLVNHDQRPFTPELLRTAFIGGISFQLDVPRVRNCPEAFNQMALLARKMESSLGGMLIDDNQRPLDNDALDKIREQLRIIYAKMVARGIIPGSPSALRLFS